MDQSQTIASAINGYFDLMYDADDNQFLEVLHGACLVHGLRWKAHSVVGVRIPRRDTRPTVSSRYEIPSRPGDSQR